MSCQFSVSLSTQGAFTSLWDAAPLMGWRPERLPADSGCDSSDCAYCQALAQVRHAGAGAGAGAGHSGRGSGSSASGAGATPQAGGCWLRRKRSRTDLAALEGGGSGSAALGATPTTSGGSGSMAHTTADEEPCLLPRPISTGTLLEQAARQQQPCSMWDHALLDDQEVAAQVLALRQHNPLEWQLQRRRWRQRQRRPKPSQQPEQQQPEQQQPEQEQPEQQQPEQQQPEQRQQQQLGAALLGAGQGQAVDCEPSPRSDVSAHGTASDSSACGVQTSTSTSSGFAAATAVDGRSVDTADPSGWYPSWQSPARLSGVATFVPPARPSHCSSSAACGSGSGSGSWLAPALTSAGDIVCALEFEEHGWLLATAGVSKQVRVYSLASCLQHPDEPLYHQPIRCHRMPSKLSSLAWNPDAPGAVTVADYDGVVSQVDMESGHLIAEVDEHSGRRVWSVSHSLHWPHLCASASEDGTVKLWGGAGMQRCLAELRPAGTAPACGVHFSPFDGNLAAVACADHCAYVYDLRRASQPLLQLQGHERAVSYVRWLGSRRLVTASTDASLAIWQLPVAAGLDAGATMEAGAASLGLHPEEVGMAAAAAAGAGAAGTSTSVLTQPWRRLRGHRNGKNFCGLSVRPEDCLVACGSEAPACYTYHQSWSAPLAVHSFAAPGGSVQCADGCGQPPGACTAVHAGSAAAAPPSQFCSAVCWQPATARVGCAPLLAAALSDGAVRVLQLHHEPTARRCLDG